MGEALWRSRSLSRHRRMEMLAKSDVAADRGHYHGLARMLLRSRIDGESCSAHAVAAPFIAFNAASAIISIDGRDEVGARAIVATAVLTAVLLPGFLLGYYGNRAAELLPPAEVQGDMGQ